MTALRFQIRSWCAAAPGLLEQAQWEAWAASGGPLDGEAPLRSPSRLPPLARRRLSKGSRLAIECSLEALGGEAPACIVFASRHAELPRCEQLLGMLARGEPLSPAAFTMSVHNAAAGSLTILAKCRAPHVSIAAGEETFSMALLEAFAALSESGGPVLLTAFENAMPPLLGGSFAASGPAWPWAAALVLERGGQLEAEPLAAEPAAAPQLDEALQFLRGFCSGAPRFETVAGGRRWRWSRR